MRPSSTNTSVIFFFSSRRRHTRSKRDWSSDVCSSDLIQRRSAAGMPVLGTCAGMILMSRDIQGGRADQEPLKLMDIGVRRNAYGRQIDSFEAVVESPAIGGAGPAVFIRAPRVTERAPDVQELASHAGQTVAVKQGNRLALAFHPELTADRRWHQYFLTLDGEDR